MQVASSVGNSLGIISAAFVMFYVKVISLVQIIIYFGLDNESIIVEIQFDRSVPTSSW